MSACDREKIKDIVEAHILATFARFGDLSGQCTTLCPAIENALKGAEELKQKGMEVELVSGLWCGELQRGVAQ